LRRAVQETRFSEPLRLGVMPENGVGSMEMTELRPGWAEGRSLKGPDQLSAILYTSGSTGEPKGIMLTKKNLESFVDWAATTFEIGETDRLASHAPLYFDLSIFDIFCGLTRRASVYLIDEEVGRFPGAIRSVIEKAQLTVWYSVPTALVHLQRRQALKGLQSLRHILFAGEVFPVPALRQLVAQLPTARYTNLYGPTETNVCTYYQLPASIESDDEPVPIGWPCEHLSISILDDQGSTVQHGEIGEICVSGPAVMSGYWGRPEATRSTRFKDQSDTYMTGDFAYQRTDGALMFVGRRDQQIKLRGYRIELLALQTVLNAYPGVHEASVLFVPELRRGGLAAFVVPNGSPATEADIRAFIAERLPPHYQPDHLEWLSELPRTANGKCDRARLTAMVRLAAEA
jgi:amino acid adenylation domain-containing protein